MGDLLTERKALVVPEPEPDSDSNQERKDDRERGKYLQELCRGVGYLVFDIELCCEPLQVRRTVDFAIPSFKRSLGAPFSLPVSVRYSVTALATRFLKLKFALRLSI